MLEAIDYSNLNFDLFEETYKNILKKSNKDILEILLEMQEFEIKNKGKDFESLIIKFIHHKDKNIRLFTTKYIEKSTDLDTFRIIKNIIIDENESKIRYEAIRILGNWISSYSYKKNKKNEIDELLNFGLNYISEKSDKEDQNNMIKSLSYIDSEKIEKIISEKYNSINIDDILCSAISMGNNGKNKWIPLIEKLLEHDNYQIRSSSCISLSLIGDEDHLDRIKELLDDEELETQKSAVLAISNIGGNYAKEILEKLKFSTEPEIIEISKNMILELKQEEELDSTDAPEEKLEDISSQDTDDYKNNDFDEYDAGKIEGWGTLNTDGTSFIAPDAIDTDINDPIKSLSDYEKPVEQPDIEN
jgi:HEAT repeat protein|tara:strand:+ start:3386 stop:4465 length:1080 start_codon:yes stop_codon:yes gene_type:complete